MNWFWLSLISCRPAGHVGLQSGSPGVQAVGVQCAGEELLVESEELSIGRAFRAGFKPTTLFSECVDRWDAGALDMPLTCLSDSELVAVATLFGPELRLPTFAESHCIQWHAASSGMEGEPPNLRWLTETGHPVGSAKGGLRDVVCEGDELCNVYGNVGELVESYGRYGVAGGSFVTELSIDERPRPQIRFASFEEGTYNSPVVGIRLVHSSGE